MDAQLVHGPVARRQVMPDVGGPGLDGGMEDVEGVDVVEGAE